MSKQRNLIVEELRGNTIEAIHRVSGIAFQRDKELLRFGNTEHTIPMRSIAKPLMLLPLLEECEKANIVLSPEMISILASSHNGEIIHRNMVEKILELSQSTVADLHCGSHMPYFEWLYNEFFSERDEQRRQLFHNCSGKHAGMILLAVLKGVKKNKYWEINHPVQIAIRDSVRELLENKDSDIDFIALDGCGVPTYCSSLSQMAKAYQSLYRDKALKRVYDSIMKEPFFNSGTDRIELEIIKQCGFFAKSGSSGLFCVFDPMEEISVAIKVEDGHDEISESAIVEVLLMLGLLKHDPDERLYRFRNMTLYTSTNEVAGKYNPVWTN